MASVNMTSGNIPRHLLNYALPLVLGNIFQLTYNAVDAMIVGRFIGEDALAATGTAGPVMNIVILGISGICIGAGVLMSEFFGAGKEKLLRKELGNTLILGLVFSVLTILVGILATPLIVRALHVPEEIQNITEIYLRIVMCGAPFTYFYNALAAGLKSVGDAATPLKFLIFSSLLNGGLDLILIGIFHLGIRCSAMTTVVAEAVSAVLCFDYVCRRIPELRLERSDCKMDASLLKQTLQYGTVTALQQACQPIGKVLIQGSVNTLGVDAIAAFNAATRMDDFAFTPQQSLAHAITTFIAQNRGAGKEERIRQGVKSGLRLEFCYWILICTVTLLLHRPFLGLFVKESHAGEIVELGSQYLMNMAFFYLFPAFTNGIQGIFRGFGRMRVTLLATFIQASLRVIGTFILVPRIGIAGISYACVVGWVMMLLYEVPLCVKMLRKVGAPDA